MGGETTHAEQVTGRELATGSPLQPCTCYIRLSSSYNHIQTRNNPVTPSPPREDKRRDNKAAAERKVGRSSRSQNTRAHLLLPSVTIVTMGNETGQQMSHQRHTPHSSTRAKSEKTDKTLPDPLRLDIQGSVKSTLLAKMPMRSHSYPGSGEGKNLGLRVLSRFPMILGQKKEPKILKSDICSRQETSPGLLDNFSTQEN